MDSSMEKTQRGIRMRNERHPGMSYDGGQGRGEKHVISCVITEIWRMRGCG